MFKRLGTNGPTKANEKSHSQHSVSSTYDQKRPTLSICALPRRHMAADAYKASLGESSSIHIASLLPKTCYVSPWSCKDMHKNWNLSKDTIRCLWILSLLRANGLPQDVRGIIVRQKCLPYDEKLSRPVPQVHRWSPFLQISNWIWHWAVVLIELIHKLGQHEAIISPINIHTPASPRASIVE